MMENKKRAPINEIEAAATSRWLASTLAPARRRSRSVPTAEAVERMRARVFGDEMPKRRKHSIAA